MSLREMVCWWLRGVRATAVNLDEALTRRRETARQDAAWEADAVRFEAEIAAARAKLARLAQPARPTPHSLEALMLLPTVMPDRSAYRRPDVGSAERAVIWLRHSDPDTWWKYDPWTLLPLAENLMRMQHDVRHGLVTP